MFRLIVLFVTAALLTGCSALDELATNLLNESVGEDPIRTAIMGENDTIIAEGLSISGTEATLGTSNLFTIRELPDAYDEDPLYEDPVEGIENLFTAADYAIMDAFEAANPAMVGQSLIPASTITAAPTANSYSYVYVHLPDQADDFTLPMESGFPYVGYWILDRIVVDHAYLDDVLKPNRELQLAWQADLTLTLFDGIGETASLPNVTENPDVAAIEAAKQASAFTPITITTSKFVPVLHDCGNYFGRVTTCVIRPNLPGGELRIPIRLEPEQLDDVLTILKEGEAENGLFFGMRVRSELEWQNPYPEEFGLPFRIDPTQATIRLDWRIEEFRFRSE